ncbi:MAG: site-specific DNA-methyltransferase [Acidobacteria bacterium]|nr:site-specific DNA-methyltransferase [Acidobacteriota bacterium]MBI3656611.1 site-specific DNA-methyltransferase [Acidobacteriota bacterium]
MRVNSLPEQMYRPNIKEYLIDESTRPCFLQGDALEVLKDFPDNSLDCCMTSPPYWSQRVYSEVGIGTEGNYKDYISSLAAIMLEVQRVLKPTGSLWLNIGDVYVSKQLLGIPWRVALELIDNHGWILRNSVIWHKVKGGPDNSYDKLRNVHENIFHFVKSAKYYYDTDSIRSNPQTTKVVNGAVVSSSGVSGIRYKRQIELSTALSEQEKKSAIQALESILEQVRSEKLADFRMIIRGHQRTTHSDSEKVSGRARELNEKGFYFLKYHPNGSKPKDVWDILPEDTQKRNGHYAAYPEDLCKIPILATCPKDGIVLDPFCGTGTTMLVAFRLGRKSVGIDISDQYLAMAEKRCGSFLL